MKVEFSLKSLRIIFMINLFYFIYGETIEEESRYDHHAILGSESYIFDKLSPSESKAKLSVIIDKMDLNHDGRINMFELTSWIRNVYANIFDDNLERQWKDVNINKAEKISFETYLKRAYKKGIDGERAAYVKTDHRKWNASDLDKDYFLNKTEFFRFIHPEEFPDLKSLLALESLEVLDANHDGVLDVEEYLSDFFHNDTDAEMEWVKDERRTFHTIRDKNRDGFLDVEEVQMWILPDSYDRNINKAEDFMTKAKAGKHKILTKEEILDKYYIFVGSRQGDFHGNYPSHEDL